MFFGTVIPRCFLPTAVVIAETKGTQPQDQQNPGHICRPSELPIYTSDPPPLSGSTPEEENQKPNFIENSVRTVRHTFGKYTEEITAYERVAKQSFDESKQNIAWLIDYLRQEDNTLPKAGAISIGALTGLIFGLRGGFFKRTIYATTGALGMASVCYPKEASEYAQVGAVEGKKYLTIAYNFVYGDNSTTPKVEDVKNSASVSNSLASQAVPPNNPPPTSPDK
ncbi:hypothetical protein ABEB36_002780 [Hypothenemus hampei]|uniref:MICOS complex subunit n=1 Tax=Hypothenemus hampei TaxID=57062 RepID=A0ABD1F6Z4_HYPHA